MTESAVFHNICDIAMLLWLIFVPSFFIFMASRIMYIIELQLKVNPNLKVECTYLWKTLCLLAIFSKSNRWPKFSPILFTFGLKFTSTWSETWSHHNCHIFVTCHVEQAVECQIIILLSSQIPGGTIYYTPKLCRYLHTICKYTT